jgi:putative ABC transport system ATP-binding protein
VIASGAALCLRAVRKQYAGGGAAVLAGVDLAVARGECVAILGPSGAGKSTLLKIAAGLLAPDAGAVEVDGDEPWRRGEAHAAAFRRRRLGVLFQGGELLPELDVETNAALPLLLDGRPDARACARRRLAEFGIGALARRRPAQLSGGEVVRAALARALVAAPRVILCDEPTGSLDPEAAGVVAGALRTAADRGAAVLVVTHDPALAAAADRRLQLVGGRLR